MPDAPDRQWDSWHEVFEAKRHGSCTYDHDPHNSARIEADLYCIEHNLPSPGREDNE